MAAAYKLTYFNVTGLGEPVRLILSYGNIDFEDIRITFDDNWPSIKPTLPIPYGQLPIFEHAGKIAHQSLAICRYAAKQAKLVGSNDWEDLEIDAAADTINDFRLKFVDYYYEKDPKVKEPRKATLYKEMLPFYIEKFEKQIEKNNGYFAIGKLTWADLYFVGLLEILNFILGKDLTDGAPGLRGINEKVRAIPQIKAYLDKRPPTIR
ncbi:unnamed protein product [Psylliodes chrysocephalus]|uniref:glutathione transferase n=1 Tax=Psylliodes chrysocephalus TaxID=3402493 RepID=A0A9P0G7A7_9CUCU|nr:unnamed protein product [Psylliodes chrysocephala]